MGHLKSVIFDIQEELETGDKTFQQISKEYKVSAALVEEVFQEMLKQESHEYL